MSIFHALFRSPNQSPKSGLSAATRRVLLLIGAQVAMVSYAQAACIDPATFVTTTVSIYRNFNAEERKRTPGVVGIAGTGWFLSPRLLVTAPHVAEAMSLSLTEWKDIEI